MLKINNLYFNYRGKKNLFNELNINLEESKIYGLLGKNGAGKTTLFKLICGILLPTKGEILIDDISVKTRGKDYLKNLSILPEKIDLPFKDFKIIDFIKIMKKFYEKFDEQKFFQYLNEFEIDKNEFIKKLSAGNLKKFYLSFIFASNTKIILLDEPTSNLDIPSKDNFRNFVINNFHNDRIIIISSHNVKDFHRLLDHLIIIYNGNIKLNIDLNTLSEKIGMVFVDDLNEIDKSKIIYYSNYMGKYAVLVERKDQYINSKEPDIELIFMATINNKLNFLN